MIPAVARHTKTDPACSEYRGHREPQNLLSRYLDRRSRGKSCRACSPGRIIREADK